jgi:hypothetical protein
MNTIDNSHRKPNKKHSAELPSPLEKLLSGKAGPLPLDNNRPGQPVPPAPTAAAMRPSGSAESYEKRLDWDLIENAMKNNPGLTAETAARYLDTL